MTSYEQQIQADIFKDDIVHMSQNSMRNGKTSIVNKINYLRTRTFKYETLNYVTTAANRYVYVKWRRHYIKMLAALPLSSFDALFCC